MAFTETITVSGVDCEYDPEIHIVLVTCRTCSERNEVEAWVEDGRAAVSDFVCLKCGAVNGPEG